MSDLMLLGVLQMPAEMVMSDPISTLQYVARGHEAAGRIQSDANALKAANTRIAELEAQIAAAREPEPVAWALKGRSGTVREVTEYKDSTSNWHPDFVIPLYESSVAGRNADLMPIARDLLTASDLLGKRWKSQNAEVGRRLFEHAEFLAKFAATPLPSEGWGKDAEDALREIANADTAAWDDPGQFEKWAKVKARHALRKAK